MSNQLVPINWHASLPAHLRQDTAFAEMSTLGAAFESRAFARVSTNNNTFSLVSIDGETMQVNQIDAGAVYLDVVFVKWAPHVTKTWYDGPYTAGSDAAPACFSLDGKRPDPASTNPQGDASGGCALCPKNAFSSASNGKGKACSDGQRTAIVLGADTQVSVNGAAQVLKAGGEVYGYRLPPMTGKNLRAKVKEFEKAGVNLMGVVLRAKFVSQGEVDFQPKAYLGEAEWKRSRELAASDDAQRACGLDQLPNQPLLAAPPAHAQIAPFEGGQVVSSPAPFDPTPARSESAQVVLAATPLTAPVADAAPARRRGRPTTAAAGVGALSPTIPPSPTMATAPSASPSDMFASATPPAQTNGVIQTPKASNSALDDLLAQAMA